MRIQDLSVLCADQKALLRWCFDQQILGQLQGKPCNREGCEGTISFRVDNSRKDQHVFKCTIKKCTFKKSIRHNSFFDNSKLSIPTILILTYWWVHKQTSKYIAYELKLGSPNTIVDWRNYCREVCQVQRLKSPQCSFAFATKNA